MAISMKLQGNAWGYRNHSATVRHRLGEVLRRVGSEAGSAGVVRRLAVHRGRVARMVAGGVGALGGLTVLLTGVVALAVDLPHRSGIPALVLGGAVAAAIGAYAVAWLVAPRLSSWAWAGRLRRSKDIALRLAELETMSPRAIVTGRAQRWETLSLALPLIAVALLGPLTLHGLVMLLSGELDGMTAWIGFSAVVVGHAHLVFAALAVRHVRQLQRGEVPRFAVAKCIGWVTLAAAIPGILLFALPPILTAVTGLFLAWPGFAWAAKALARERLALAS